MKRLNNKGFAFSTLLYGILAVIIVVLMLIFALYTASADQAYYYGSVFEENLNKCVEQEIALENCYANGNTDCDKTAYYSCLGIDDKNITGTKVSLRTKLLSKVVNNADGLNKTDDGILEYYFRGNSVENYISFSGANWRIIGIARTGEIKIGLFNTNGSLSWDNGNSSEWSICSLNNYLNNEFYSNLSDSAIVNKYIHYIGRFNTSTNYNASEILNNEKTATFSANVGLVAASDFVYASRETQCNSNIIGNTFCDSWMDSYSSWLISSAESSANKAYYYQAGSGVKAGSLSSSYNFIPIVYLNPDVEIIDGAGSGTSGSPYILG